MSLHEVMQGLKVRSVKAHPRRTTDKHKLDSIGWLAMPRLRANKASQTDTRKRVELLQEFVYYVFDSILIPLVRSNFYVTESSVHKYRMLFFRHDVWRCVAEPAVASLKTSMFDEVDPASAQRLLDSRRLGYSHVRLLPKEKGLRPIMNLRRRMVRRGESRLLGDSINTVLRPAYNVLQLERVRLPIHSSGHQGHELMFS